MLDCNNCKYPTACKVGLITVASGIVGYLGYKVYTHFYPKCNNCSSPRAQSPRAQSPRAQSPRAQSPRAQSPPTVEVTQPTTGDIQL